MTVSDKEVLTEFIEARIARAGNHLDELRRDVETLQETDRARITLDRNPDKTQVLINLVYRRPHPNRGWGVIIGDFVHCLRSALNNTVYSIGLTNADRFPPPDDWLLGFPIADTKDDWRKTRSAIRTLPENARAIIQSAQPCEGDEEDRSRSVLGIMRLAAASRMRSRRRSLGRLTWSRTMVSSWRRTRSSASVAMSNLVRGRNAHSKARITT